jgi:FkbM family methyltransferase
LDYRLAETYTRNLVPRESDISSKPSLKPGPDSRFTVFIGYPCHSFRFFAPQICHARGNHVAAVATDEYCVDYSHMTLWGHLIPLISLDELVSLTRGNLVDLVYFYESAEQLDALRQIAPVDGVRIIDFLSQLDELGLSHTYIPVSREREYWSNQPEESIQRFESLLGDSRSKATLRARIQTIVSADRRPLMALSVPNEYEYFNHASKHESFVLQRDEVYVDVGAAHGDTVDKFIGLTEGEFAQIYAFEPTPAQFAELSTRSQNDPRIKTYQAAVGSAAGKISFFDNIHNPFGGNALTIGSGAPTIEVDCIRLDDMVPHCTLIKMDVEGYECEVLRGATRLIRECRPNMAVTCYHYPQDLFEILSLMQEIHPYRYIALRHYSSTLYDSILLFSDHQSFEQ